MNKTLVLLLGLALSLVAETGFTYTIYNNSGKTVKVWGEHCPACFAATLAPGTYGSCPGDKLGCRGDTTISYDIPSNDDVPNPNYPQYPDGWTLCYVATAKVTNHGWVVITDYKLKKDEIPDSYNFFWSVAAVYDNAGHQRNADQAVVTPEAYYFTCPDFRPS